MKPFSKLTAKYPFLKFIGNRYVLVIIFFAVWMVFIDNYSLYFDHPVLDNEIKELEENKEYYVKEIRKDSTSIKQLQNPDQTEKYAREKYYMKREDEDIYIIEFEEEVPEEQTTSKAL
ncbi:MULTISPECIES: septum formation initiator family protein [Flavobacterium]|uniref:FtsB family cell division protein n=1 Tax=Flavobacterium TaxID=237 RepID=UPI000C392A23|nr:septum formation initiator family protein [Flavobacterium sp.]MBF01438.1 septum formation initiator [Flavobacterium sp.]|tara:strand:- start:278 stop:631 length:354 start_codon:yes stop_codon:yes gene_type:complete